MSIEKLQEKNEKNLKHSFALRSVKVLNVLLITSVFAGGWYRFCADGIASPYFAKGNWAVIFVFFVLYSAFGRVYDAFLISYHRISEMVYSQVLACIEADAILFIIITQSFCERLPMGL